MGFDYSNSANWKKLTYRQVEEKKVFLSVLFLSAIHLRRKRGVEKAPNKVCLNIFVDLSRLDYFSKSQELYTAHELAQLYPLLNRESTYEKLLEKNNWYLHFLPNASARTNEYFSQSSSRVGCFVLQILNPFFTFMQTTYMKRHQTKEIVNKELILLHPHDYKQEILKKYQAKMMEYDLLTKK